MSYAAILVHVEADPVAKRRLELAADLANQFEAALIGISAELFEPPSAAAAMGYVDGETLVSQAQLVHDDLKRAETLFREVARTVKRNSEWRSAVDLPCNIVSQQACLADLIVAGPRRAQPYGFHTHADPADLLMQSGRPVLMTPAELEVLDASSIVVAWKDTRESRRALSDALPFLKRAKQVLVASICEHRDESEAESNLQDVGDFLRRHGIKASTTVRALGGETVASALLKIAEMQDAGLVVAGGYGHSRFREWVLGGVTQKLLCDAPRAVLLSH